jgi:hypothetical protein
MRSLSIALRQTQPYGSVPDISPRVSTDALGFELNALQFDAGEMEWKEFRNTAADLRLFFQAANVLRLSLGSWLVETLVLRLKMRVSHSQKRPWCIISLYSSNELSRSKSFC